jgi:hypothetical protein
MAEMKVRERESGRIIVTFSHNPAEKYRSIPKSEDIIKKPKKPSLRGH